MKNREPRTPVSVPARYRHGAQWKDAVICNLSPRGLMFRCDVPMQRGDFLELRRGGHVIVAQVMWSDDGACGARSQDLLPIDDIVHCRPARRIANFGERRAEPRTSAQQAERSRRVGKLAEFAIIGAVGIVSAAGIAQAVYTTLSTPMQTVRAALVSDL